MARLIETQTAIDAIQRAIDAVNSADPVEAAPVVRCANCYWWGRKGHYKDGTEFIDCKLGMSGDPYGYCHRGKAKYSGQVYGGEHETD